MKKWGISKNYHVINFKTENEPKMKFFNFGAFQKIAKMPSHDKVLFHMLFGAFHDTSCTTTIYMLMCHPLVITTWYPLLSSIWNFVPCEAVAFF